MIKFAPSKSLGLKKFKKILLWFFLTLIFLLLAIWIFIQTPFGQNWIAHQVTKRLSKELQTKVEIRNIDFSLFNNMHLQGVLVEDHQQDTILYAGEIRVRITDWFFFKDHIELKYVAMENAIIKMQRTDSVWRHQFVLDYFTAPSSSKKKSGGIELSLKEAELKNIYFSQRDAWLGQNLSAGFSDLKLVAKNINFNKQSVGLASLTISDPVVSLHNYVQLKPDLGAPVNFPAVIDSAVKSKPFGWAFEIDQLKIVNGRFRNDRNDEIPAAGSFDGKHLDFTNINGFFTDVRWKDDTVSTHLTLQTNERSGFKVKKMVADMKMTPQEMVFSDLELVTNNSVIRNYYRMSYSDFGSMDDYIHQVSMQANFDNSSIDSDDIAYFAPSMQSWKKYIKLKGNIRGTVDDLVGKDLVIQAGNNTLLNGDVSLAGLPDINQTFIDFKANDFRTTYADAAAFVPAVKSITSPDLRKLQYLRFNGSFTGFIRDFVTFGTLQTNLGIIKSDLNMKLPTGQQPVYSGTIATEYFKLGDFIGDNKIGAISMNGTLKGRGFDEKSRNTEVDGKISFVDYNGYRYNNIDLKGKLNKKMFDGAVSINDPEAVLTLNGVIDFNTTTPSFNFLADVQKANLQKLKLINEDIGFKGKFNLNFSGSNIDNFLGYAHITDAAVTHDSIPLPFDSLIVSSEYINNVKKLTASSNEFKGSITGNFNIRDLPDAVSLFLNKYYPAYIKAPVHVPENQSFEFDLVTGYVDEYIKLIDSSLSGFNNSHIYGNINTAKNLLALNADVPQFKYSKYNFNDVKFSAQGTADSLSLFGGAANININDSMNVPLALFRVRAHKDTSQVMIFTGSNKAINQANLNAQVLTYNDGVRIEFDPSTLVVNEKTWSIDANGELEFRRNTPANGLLVLRESNQEIRLKTQLSETGNGNDLLVELKKVNLGDFSPLFMPNNRLEGLVSGSILAEDPFNNLRITSDEILTEGLLLDNDSLGNTVTNLVYDGKTKKLSAKGKTMGEQSSLGFDVNIFLGDKEQQKNNLIALQANNFQLKILERFLGSLFTNLQGYITGNFDIKGEFDKLQISGKGRLKNAGLKVIFTQCFYEIEDNDIELKPTEINLDGLVMRDPVTNNPIYLAGSIQHSSFRNMFFDLTVSTHKPGTTGDANNKPVQLLNTSYNDNKQFYGRVKGTGSFSLSGYQSDMLMAINAVASTADSGTVTIPSSKSRESGIADFLIERKFGREMVDTNFSANSTNVKYDVDITANPMVTVRVVLDDLTGDEIKGKGNGTLNIHSGTSDPLTIRGKYDIEEGEYLFTFQSFFKRPFKIRKGGSNYISWSGDPYTAQIEFEALYTAEDVSFAPLVNALQVDQSLARQREDVYVIAKLSGQLFKPDFKFALDFAPNSVFKNDFTVSSSIQQMTKNESEIQRQVTYLIVFNSFAPLETTQSSTAAVAGIGSAINELTYNTITSISGIFFTEINKKLNSELSKILKTDNVSINFSGSVYNRNLLNQQSSSFNINQSNFNVNVPISLFKDRFVVTLGSTLDVPLQSSIQQNVQFLPDVTAEWLINQTGTIRASFFYRQNLDYLTSNSSGAARTKRSGASIAYRKEFDTLGEFFRAKGKRKDKKRVVAPVPVTDSTSSGN